MTNKQAISLIRHARRELHDAKGYVPRGIHYREVDKSLNLLEGHFMRTARPGWANIGPVQVGGDSLLDLIPTHNTDGVPLYVATDTDWGVGTIVIAPEDVEVFFKDTHASPGEAAYLKGKSLLKYWVGHIDKNWPVGTKIAKGTVLGKTVAQQRPHGHWGVNGEAYLGHGEQFLYGATGHGPDYTLGSPSYRKQLAASEQ